MSACAVVLVRDGDMLCREKKMKKAEVGLRWGWLLNLCRQGGRALIGLRMRRA